MQIRYKPLWHTLLEKSTALQMYDRSVNALAEKKFAAMIKTDDVRSVSEIKSDIDELLAAISAAEDVLSQAIDKSRNLAMEISNIDEKLAECKMLKNRYTSLRTQYESDIRRLTFIAEGDSHRGTIPQFECEDYECMDVGFYRNIVEALADFGKCPFVCPNRQENWQGQVLCIQRKAG